MGHHHHGHSFARQFPHDIQNLADHLGVQGRGRLVKEHHVRLHRKRAHNGDTLLLAAGKLDRIGVRAVSESHALQQLQGLFLRFRLGDPFHLNGRQGHVLKDRHMREEIEVLKHHAHLLPMQVDVQFLPVWALFLRDVDAFENDAARGGDLQQVQGAQKGGFPRSGGTDDDHHVAAVDIHGHAVERLDALTLVIFLQVLDLDQLIVCHRRSSSFQNVQ